MGNKGIDVSGGDLLFVYNASVFMICVLLTDAASSVIP